MFLFRLDVDECSLAAATGLQACREDALCRNTPGSFTCSCPTGYIMAQNGHSCAGEVLFWKGRGRLGALYWVRRDGWCSSFSSTDIDECVFEQQCRPELGHVCVNTPGSFVCQCRPGFRAEAPACVGEPGSSPSPRFTAQPQNPQSHPLPPPPPNSPLCSQVPCVLISLCVKV